jgi:hypothetical protein
MHVRPKVKERKPEPKEMELVLCPKAHKCVMSCHHRIPHEHDKFCKGDVAEDPSENKNSCPQCVNHVIADVTFFEEDFEIK